MLRSFAKLLATLTAVIVICSTFALMKYVVLYQPAENKKHSPEIQQILDSFDQQVESQRIPG